MTAERIQELRAKLDRIMARGGFHERENVWHMLLLLDLPPIERYRRCLIRGRGRKPVQ